jgi:hypothetical protein
MILSWFGCHVSSIIFSVAPVIVEKRGRTVAVVISTGDFGPLQKEKEPAFAAADRVQAKNVGWNPGEVLGDVAEAVAEMRQEISVCHHLRLRHHRQSKRPCRAACGAFCADSTFRAPLSS